MGSVAVVVDAGPGSPRRLCRNFERHRGGAVPKRYPSDIESHIETRACRAMVLDWYDLPAGNRFIGKLRGQSGEKFLLGTSTRARHSDLEESMRTRVSIRMGKPVDQERLIR